VTPSGVLFLSANDAVKAVHDDYLYWTGRLTDTSLQLSYGVIAANWAAFGSVQGILGSFWSKVSVALVVIGLSLSVAGAKWMGELHGKRVDYAADALRWEAEFRANTGKPGPWPFTRQIELSGTLLRSARSWLSLAAGLSFLIALLARWT
jgi:hypothetical protein